MALINLTLAETAADVLAGIPKNVAIVSDIYSNIFYTLDGSTPTILSSIYIDPIDLPTDKPSVVLKVFASNGIDESDIITKKYAFDRSLYNIKSPMSNILNPGDAVSSSSYPFGSGTINFPIQYGAINPLKTVYSPLEPATPHAFDADGIPTSYTNAELLNIPTDDLQIVHATRDSHGNSDSYIGTMPKIINRPLDVPIPEQTNLYSTLFNPKSMVVFQDLTKPIPENSPQVILGNYVDLQNDITTDYNNFYRTASELPGPKGGFVNRHYNPTDKTMTSYFFDSSSNRWLISKAPYSPDTSIKSAIYNTVSPNRQGMQFVYKWIPFKRSYLF